MFCKDLQCYILCLIFVQVLSEGHVEQYGHPYELLQDTEGAFYSMVQQTGGSTSHQLISLAKSTYHNTDRQSIATYQRDTVNETDIDDNDDDNDNDNDSLGAIEDSFIFEP